MRRSKAKGAVGTYSIKPQDFFGFAVAVLYFHFVNKPSGKPLEKTQGKEISLVFQILQKRDRLFRKMTQRGVEDPGFFLVVFLTQPRHQSTYEHRRSEVAKCQDSPGTNKKSVAHFPRKIVPGDPHQLFQKIFP